MEQGNYKSTNLEIINTWKNKLKDDFVSNMPTDINLLEKTKIIKKNILHTLNVAYNLSAISIDKEIFDTTASMLSIEKEMEKIKKDTVSIAVFGQMSSGKSSFLNSLVGEELLTVAEERATATITVIRHIDNFDGQEDGNIEIHYKSENEIIENIDKSLNELDAYFTDEPRYLGFVPENIDELLSKKDELLTKLSNSPVKEVERKYKKLVKENKKQLELILNGLESNKENLGKVSKLNSLESDVLINPDKSVFITNVIFYKNINLLRNIELIDTPGLGSNSQLDTRKSEEFIEKADIVMVLTDAKEPMQKDSETDILHVLEEIQKSENNKDFFDKVFIVINKIDDTASDRIKIRALLEESLDDAEIEIKDRNILFISAFYEYQKRFSENFLKNLPLKNKDNIGKNDLEKIEKTIYDFSAAEATSKFLNENMQQIDDIFSEVNRNFENSIEKLDGSIEETQKKINRFKENKKDIKKELEVSLTTAIKDKYREILGTAYTYRDDSLNKVSNYDYYHTRAKKQKMFESATSNKNSDYHYQSLAKNLMKNIINETNRAIEVNIKNNVFTDKTKNQIKENLQNKTKTIQIKYENDYGVILNMDKIDIGSININLSKNIDLNIGMWKSFKQFINLTIWFSEAKYNDISSEGWANYSKGIYKGNLTKAIKEEIKKSELIVQEEVNKAIEQIVITVEKQLKQELSDRKRYAEDKEKTTERKTQVHEAFKTLESDFISIAKEQNKNLFK